MSQDSLGGLQQLAMLAVLKLGDDAYGATVQQELEHTAGRSVAISTVYVTMERLERKGLVSSYLGEPTPVRGGRAKRRYALTADGVAALNASREEMERMWRAVESTLDPGMLP
jgi:DNA-binding PadR family transcriptional regulator